MPPVRTAPPFARGAAVPRRDLVGEIAAPGRGDGTAGARRPPTTPAESWDSGASAWILARREAYANDQDASTSLATVTDRANQAKADRDPAEWMPPLPHAHCRYIGKWVGTKMRWGLTANQADADSLATHGEACETTVVHYAPAP
ncbi:hypothetical protein ACFV5J_32310 [Streptomyces zaomyceticus]|uniref:hypothetical protein n=1 Tax=Streptomyces zaomyceticus TaxID=68286 RepID=UPI003667F6E9